MSWAVLMIYVLSVASFCAAFFFSGFMKSGLESVSIMREAMAVVTNKTVSDSDKERMSRDAAARMFRLLIVILLKISICVGAALFPVLVADFVGFLEMDESRKFALRLDVILITSLVLVGVFLGGIKSRRG